MSAYAKSSDSRVTCNDAESVYKCADGTKHTIRSKTYSLKSVHGHSPSSPPIASIYVEKEGTVINASQMIFMGDKPNTISSYGGYVKDNGKLVLKDSTFADIPALRAQNGVIEMTDGKIGGISHAIYASGKKADIALVRVNVEIVPDNLNAKDIGIVSGFSAFVRMSGSTVTFKEIGAFSSQYGGRYLLDNMTIKGEGKKYTVLVDNKNIDKLPEAFDISQGGDVHLRDNSIQLTDMHGFFIENFTSFGDGSGNLLQEYNSSNSFKKTDIKIESSNITIQGEKTYGLYFNAVGPREFSERLNVSDEKLSEAHGDVIGTASVSLSKTTFTVQDGIAIYSTGPDGYGAESTLELSEGTRISGDLLLKADNNSSITVKASDTTLTGGVRVEDISTVHLQLTRSSTWYLKKSKKDSQENNSTDSFLSSLSLLDSTVIFKKDSSNNYQTLRIGTTTNIFERDGYGIGEAVFEGSDYKQPVYSAKGNSRIKLSAFLNDDGSFDTQKTDRVLIYGDVEGTTLIEMQDFPRISEKKIKDGKDQSVSLIQVSGKATEDSFKLMDRYATINGFPYQYRLRGYGLGSSYGQADPKNRLVAGEGDFWDFRLVGIYINPKDGSSETETIKPVSTDLTAPSSTPSSPTESSSSGKPPVSVPDVPVTPSSIEPSVPVPSSTPIDSTSASSPSSSVEPSSVPEPVPDVPSTPILPTPSPAAPSDPVVPQSPVAPVPELPVPSVPSTPIPPTPSPAVPSEPVDSQPTDPTPPPSTPLSPTSSPVAPVPIKPDIQIVPKIRAVVPQLPTYLLLPNALFHAGFMDLTTQNKKLETIRNSSISSLKSHENSAFFVRGYGGNYHYASNLSAFEYGYGAELDYSAFEAGIFLKEIERTDSRTFFGLMGTYGSLSLHPLNVEQSKKSTFDRWSVSAYGSLQDDMGFYVDGLLTHGLFKGDVFTLARDKVATLKGKHSNASLTSGQRFSIGHNGFIFDPQLQLIYQRLQFDDVRDVDNLDVSLGNFNQWTARFGGRLTKILTPSEKERIVSFYGKLYFSRNFGDRRFVSFKNDFQLGAFGSSLEAGIGFNAQLSAKFAFHGDVNYQHRVTKAGFSGASFSTGLRYLF